MNTDGTIKEDEASRAWQEALSYPEFTRALEISIDAEEVVDTVYTICLVNPYFDCNNDITGANDLLDQAGFLDINGDGYRETPSVLICNGNSGLRIPARSVALHGVVGRILAGDRTEGGYLHHRGLLLSTSRSANEIPMEVLNLHSTQTWFQADYGNRDNVLWNAWKNAGGLTGNAGDGYVVPPDEYVTQLKLINSLFLVSPSEAINVIIPQIMANCQENHWIIEPVIDMMDCTLANSDIGNMPTGGNSIAGNFGYGAAVL
jgi:hypothetical protein